ncbi:MAG TPA: hypothetical protein VF272_00280 [Candidatus Saccharimonadia bacterium]
MQQNLFLKSDSMKRVPAEDALVMALDRQEDELLLRFLTNDSLGSVSQIRLEEDMASQLLQMLAAELHVPVGA